MGLKVLNVSKSYGTKKVVDNISFSIDRPGVFGLIGTNGAGKTTTIRMILSVTDKDEGEISWNGGEIRRDTVRFGYMPEERGIYPKVKIGEQLVYFGMLRGMSRADASDSMKRLTERLGVAEYREVFADKLSKGNQQKVQFAATLIHDPELIFLDEPFSGLDPLNTEVFKGVIAELIDRDKTIIMSSHQMSTVEEYCRDVLLLDSGKTLLQGDLKEIKAGYGHTTLSMSCADSDTDIVLESANRHGIKLREKNAGGFTFAINGDEMPRAMLADLVKQGIFPEAYAVRFPTLHEIFVEKVGGGI